MKHLMFKIHRTIEKNYIQSKTANFLTIFNENLLIKVMKFIQTLMLETMI